MDVRRVVNRESYGALVLALAIPLLFLDESHEPGLDVGVGFASFHVTVSEVAVAAVLVAAAAAVVMHGALRLNAARIVWIPGVALFCWLGFETFRPVSYRDALFERHIADYAELLAYALIAVAVPLVVRRAQDLTLVVGVLVLWSGVATGVASAQLAGVDILDAGAAGGRQPSFLTIHDLAGLSVLALAIAAAGIIATRRRIPAPALFFVALLGGGLGLVISGSIAAVAGFAIGAILAILVARARLAPSGPRGAGLLALAALLILLAIGVTAVRTGAAESLAEEVGATTEDSPEQAADREVMTYIGLRVFRDNPILGVGLQRSSRFDVTGEYVDDARKRYPDEPDASFPTGTEELGIENLYVQLLADAGAIGLLLLLAIGVGGLVLCWRTATYASTPWAAGAGLAMMCALLGLAGEWTLVGLSPGIPLQTATALALGLAAAGAATVEDESGG